MKQRTTDDLEELRRLLEAAHRIVFFTGAGISTESGIPDFRSHGTGLWTKMQPTQFQDFVASEAIRQESWRRRFTGERSIENAKPNKGHEAIAKLIRDGKAIAVITQNVDNLHQDSGIDPSQVIELHGNASYAKCLDCQTRYEMIDLKRQFTDTGRVAPCGECGGVIKNATISFGQAMPEREMRRAQEQTLRCDLFVVVGSSLVVYPAAGFPELAKQLGAKLVIVNREPTPLDSIADLVVHREIGQTLSFAVGIN
jgi:NAD-dependent deacetylase